MAERPASAPIAERRPIYRGLQAVVRGALMLSADFEVEGEANYPSRGPYIVAINHLHLLDLVVAFTTFRHEPAGLAWVGLAHHPLYGPIARHLGHAIFVQNESDHRAMARATAWLRSGGVLLVAPEGSRSPTAALQRGHPGAAYLAARTGAPIVPVGAWGHERLPDALRRLRRGRIRVRIGKPFVLEAPGRRLKTDALDVLTTQIMRAIASLLPDAYRGAYATEAAGAPDANSAAPPARVVTCRFYAELSDFLAPDKRAASFRQPVAARATVKEVIEALRVPHTEVDLILVNGRSVDFGHRLADGDRLAVYPVFETLDIQSVVRVRPRPLRDPRFVLDAHLGKLAGYLRLLGFDALYRNDFADAELCQVSGQQHRILLTRDRDLLERRAVTHGYWIRETHPRQQLHEVMARFDLDGLVRHYQRCTRCNGLLEDEADDRRRPDAQPPERNEGSPVRRCRDCGLVYDRRGRDRRLQALLAALPSGTRAEAAQAPDREPAPPWGEER